MRLITVLTLGYYTAAHGQQTVYPCPTIMSSNPFSLPTADTATGWAPVLAFRNTADVDGGGTGLSFVDVNDDQLVDLVWSYEEETASGDNLWQCVYLNTQCGWGKSVLVRTVCLGSFYTRWP
jgi:hypothetical protein